MIDDERARALLTAAADPPGGPSQAPVQELLARARRQRRRRQGILVVAAIAATLIAVIVPTEIVGGNGRRTTPAGHHSNSPSPRPPSFRYPSTGSGSAVALAASHWSRLPKAPIPGRTGAVSVWTGKQMLVWGGGIGAQNVQLRSDGAAYDPATEQWSPLPTSPLSGRTDAAAAWTGHAMFVWGGYDESTRTAFHAADDGALYDPTTRSWRRLPAAPLSARVGATALWTGSEVVVIGGHPAVTTSRDEADSDAAAYNPATNSWRMLPAPPTTHRGDIESTVAIAADDSIYEWLSWDHVTTLTKSSSRERIGIDVDRFDLAGRKWTAVHATGAIPDGVSSPQWTGQEIVMPAAHNCPSSCPFVGGTFGWRFDPATMQWTTIAAGPGDALNAQSVWTGKALLEYNTDAFIGSNGHTRPVLPGDAEVWAPDANRWTRLPGAPYAGDPESVVSVWTGSQLLMWGEMSPGRHDNGSQSFPERTIGLSFGG